MEINTILVMDTNESYAMNISTMLEGELNRFYTVLTFTNIDKLVEYAAVTHINTLIVTQSAFTEKLMDLNIDSVIVLNEDDSFENENVFTVRRYQPACDIIKAILAYIKDNVAVDVLKGLAKRRWKVIGIYSPIHRSLQTSFSITLGQMLAEQSKTLYMNFENFSGFSGWMSKEFESDIVDLLYFFDCDVERLASRISLAVHSIGNLDILPPAQSYFDTYDRTGEKWVEFLNMIEKVTDYEYLILDLTDAMQGLLQVMTYCDRIYTLVRNDSLSTAKLEQYEKWMIDHAYAEIMSKSLRFNLPVFEKLPANPEYLTKSELAGYVWSIINEDEY